MPQNIVAPYTMKEINARLDESERDIEEGRYYTTEEVFHPHYHSLDEFADKLAKKLGEHYGLTDIREMLQKTSIR